jgi:hypothetical protein
MKARVVVLLAVALTCGVERWITWTAVDALHDPALPAPPVLQC